MDIKACRFTARRRQIEGIKIKDTSESNLISTGSLTGLEDILILLRRLTHSNHTQQERQTIMRGCFYRWYLEKREVGEGEFVQAFVSVCFISVKRQLLALRAVGMQRGASMAICGWGPSRAS